MKTQNKTKTWEEMRHTARRILPVACLLSLAVGTAVVGSNDAMAITTWGPERPTYSWQHPSDHPVFNSITDNPSLKDERNFVRVGEANSKEPYVDTLNLEVGKEYEVYIYYHNNAASNLNQSGVGMAQDVRLFVDMPGVVYAGHAGEIKGTIKASNTNPESVWDTAYVLSDTTVALRYVANSAVIHNEGTADLSVLNSEGLFGDAGSMLGHSKDHWGYIPGCNEYAGFITFRFVVDQAGFELSKTASHDQKNEYGEKITVKPGDVIDFKIDYKNTGTINQKSIMAYDELPSGLSYINSTSFLTTSWGGEGSFVSDKLFNGGINLGDTEPGDYMSLTYKVKVSDNESIFACGDSVLYNNASIATANGTGTDKVEITVHRDCLPDELPKTGPTEIVMAVLVILGIAIGGGYYVTSRKKLQDIEKMAK